MESDRKERREKFTPGPWHYNDVWSLVEGPGREEICAVHAAAPCDTMRVGKYTAKHNAALIASAPDLYAALVDVLSAERGTMDEVRARRRASEALRKARGEE